MCPLRQTYVVTTLLNLFIFHYFGLTGTDENMKVRNDKTKERKGGNFSLSKAIFIHLYHSLNSITKFVATVIYDALRTNWCNRLS
jgi:hypothetical protein